MNVEFVIHMCFSTNFALNQVNIGSANRGKRGQQLTCGSLTDGCRLVLLMGDNDAVEVFLIAGIDNGIIFLVVVDVVVPLDGRYVGCYI